MRLPTVRVVNPSQPDSYVIINESDFVQGKHQLYDSPILPHPVALPLPSTAQAIENTDITLPGEAQPVGASDTAGADDLHVAKGPGGKWFVWRGKQIVSGRLDSEDAAAEALRNMRELVA